MHRYDKPGKYVAICNKMNFDGHYIKIFDFPEKHEDENYVEAGVDAAWYFLNRVDYVACIEAVYPIEIFKPIVENTGKEIAEEYARLMDRHSKTGTFHDQETIDRYALEREGA